MSTASSHKPRVSVVMPVRDGERFLEEAIASVLSQTFDDLELIAVDDGSTDCTPELLAGAARRDPRVRVLHQAPAGRPAARNYAWSVARGQYLACLDADDVALPTRLEQQVALLDRRPELAVVGGAGVVVDEDGTELTRVSYPADPAAAAALLAAGRSPLIHSAATMRLTALRSVGGYRRAFVVGQDYDLWLRLVAVGLIGNVDEVVVHYRLHGSQAARERIEATAVATRAALASARARDRGEPDPLDVADALDDVVLRKLGVRHDEVAAQCVDYALWLARTLAAGNRITDTKPLFRACRSWAADTAEPRATTARVLRTEARVEARRGSFRAAALRARARLMERL